MKNFLLFLLLIVFTFVMWVFSFPRGLEADKYLSKEILAKSTPFNVKIDVTYIKSLNSAYE